MLRFINIFSPLVFFLFVSCSSLLYYPMKQHVMESSELPFKVDDEFFTAEDGTRLHGWYFHSDVTNKPRAKFVYFHGNAENISTHFRSLIWLLSFPYDFAIFDYRGYGKSEGNPSPEGTVIDGKAAIRWVSKKSSQAPLVIFGQSLGGAIALKAVLEIKNEVDIRLVVVESTFASYRAAARAVMSRNFLLWILQPLAYVLFSDAMAPDGHIADLSPLSLIVIHGQKDPIIDYDLGRKVYELAKEPKELWTIPDGRHTDTFWRHREYRQKLLQALEKAVAQK